MKTSNKGLVQIAALEGIVPAPYLDSVGILTYGVGHTKAAGGRDPAMMFPGMPADLNAEILVALKMFQHDIVKYENRVNDAVTVPILQHEFDALVSFDYNTGGIHRAALTKHLNRGDRMAAAGSFMGWLKPIEIKSRREKEQTLFSTGEYTAAKIPVWNVGTNYKLGGILKTFTQGELLELLDGPNIVPITSAKGFSAFLAFMANLFGGKK